MDHNAGSWIIDVEGIGRKRKITGIVWTRDNGPLSIVFHCDELVVLNQNLEVGNTIVPGGALGRIVGIRDPTLTAKHHKFLEVCLQGAHFTAWIGIEEVVGGSYSETRKEDQADSFDNLEEDEPEEPIPPTIN